MKIAYSLYKTINIFYLFVIKIAYTSVIRTYALRYKFKSFIQSGTTFHMQKKRMINKCSNFLFLSKVKSKSTN